MFLFYLFVVRKAPTQPECPLIEDGCKFKLKDGSTPGNRISIPLGVKCELRFTNCIIGGCYTIYDHTFTRGHGNPPGPALSIFNNFTIAHGLLTWKASQVFS